VYEGVRLKYAGKVGTGFDDRKLLDLRRRLDAIASVEKPFDGPTSTERKAHWVKPKLVAEVTFSEWTSDGNLRHPVFLALRTDKPAKSIVREQPMASQK
jgi:bifunctional non-homologous end joining protein LigD